MSEPDTSRAQAVLLVEETPQKAQPLREVLQEVRAVADGDVHLVYCPPQYARVRACQRRYVVRCLVTDNAMAGRPRLGLDLVRYLGGGVPCVVWSGSTQGLGDEAAALNRAFGAKWVFVRHAADPVGLRRLVSDILAGQHSRCPVVSDGDVPLEARARVHELRHTVMGCFLAVDIDLQQWCRDRVAEGESAEGPGWDRVQHEMRSAVDQATGHLEAWRRHAKHADATPDELGADEVASLLGPVGDTIDQIREHVARAGATPDPETLLELVRRVGTQLQLAVEAVDRGRRQARDRD